MKTGTLIVGAVTGLAAGGAVGYFFARRQLQGQYELELEEAVQEVKDYYNALFIARSEGYDTVAEAAEALIEPTSAEKLVKSAKQQQADIIEEMGYEGEEPKETPTATVSNIFAERDNRKSGLPYLIDMEEFMEEYRDDKGRVYDKINLMWFDGDGVLCDEAESMIPEPDDIVGLDNMNRFGEGEDSMILHIRNEKARADYEVAKDERTYAEVAFGITEKELDDTPRKRVKKTQQEE